MRKMRLVCIILGVLILVGMVIMSGVALAQTTEEPQSIQNITFEEFFKSPESFVGKEVELTEGTVVSMLMSGSAEDSPDEIYLVISPQKEMFLGFNRGPFTSIYLSSSLLATKKDKKIVEVGDIITIKGLVQVATKEEIKQLEKKSDLTLDESVKLSAYYNVGNAMWAAGQINFGNDYIEKAYYIVASEIKITGRISPPKQKEALQEKTIEIPDYENFPYKHQNFYRDEDDIIQFSYYFYVREFESTDKRITMDRLMKAIESYSEYQEGEQIALVTLKDVIIIETVTIEESFSETILIWRPEVSISVLEVADSYIVIESISWEDWEPAVRLAIKENGQWKFIGRETLKAKGEEFMQKYRKKQKEKQD